MSSISSSPSSGPVLREASEVLRPKRLISQTAVRGWMVFAIILFLLETIPYLSCRWVTDESWYSAPAYSIAHGNGFANPAMGANDIENHFDARPPGTALVIAAAFRLFGTGQIPARLGSILAGLAIIFFTYRLARDVIGDEGALVAAFLVATDNLIVLTSRTARPEALTTMAIMASLLAMKQYGRRYRILWALMSGVLLGIGTTFHITVLGFIVSLGILAIVLDCRRGGFPLRGAFAYALGYGLGILPFATWLLTAPMGRMAFRAEYVNRGGIIPLWSRFLQEWHRYSDLLGFNMVHGHGLESIPIRIPIPLFFLAASFLLWKMRRRQFYLELLLLLPTMLWFSYITYRSSRYLALLAPIFALVVGASVAAASDDRRLHRVLLSLSCLVIAAQMSASFYLLHQASFADYDKVGAELRSVIPPGQTAYGTIAFWLALRDRSFISYQRTDPWMAANQFHARYFITGDRVMASGNANDSVFYGNLQRSISGVIAQSKLVGQFPDPYYGDLKVYEFNAH